MHELLVLVGLWAMAFLWIMAILAAVSKTTNQKMTRHASRINEKHGFGKVENFDA